MPKETVDVLIIGAGPSGTVAAAYLSKYNFRVKIVEKSKFPRYTIGESLIPRCMDNFEEAGLLDCLKKQNYQIKTGARFIKGSAEGIFDFSEKFGEGWNWTWQVPRDDFDFQLSEECKKKGVEIDFETEVHEVVFSENPVKSTVRLASKSNGNYQVEATYIIDASGYGRVLAKQLQLEAKPQIAAHSSLFTQVKDIRRPKGKEGTLITFDVLDIQVWFWYIPFSNGNTSLGFVGPNEWFNQFSPTPEKAFAEMLPLTPTYYSQFKELSYLFTPQKVENISKNVTQLYGPGFVLTGNSSTFLDPVFSSGVSFATESGLLAAKLIAKELKGQEVDWKTAYDLYIKQGVEVFSSYVKEWYSGNLQKLILHPNPNLEIKKQVCAVLAGYVWNNDNPAVKKHQKLITNVARLIDAENI